MMVNDSQTAAPNASAAPVAPSDGAQGAGVADTPQAAPAVQEAPAEASQDQSAPSLPEPDEAAEDGVNLNKAYSLLNERIAELFDGLGVRRSATIPHVKGEEMADHIGAISKVLPQIGGVTSNILTATHTAHAKDGGATVAHPASKLQETVIPKEFPAAAAAVSAAKSFVNKVVSLIGETPEVKTAKSQLDLVGKHGMQGMTAYDAGAALLSVPGPLLQLLARKYSEVQHGGEFMVQHTGPQQAQATPED